MHRVSYLPTSYPQNREFQRVPPEGGRSPAPHPPHFHDETPPVHLLLHDLQVAAENNGRGWNKYRHLPLPQYQSCGGLRPAEERIFSPSNFTPRSLVSIVCNFQHILQPGLNTHNFSSFVFIFTVCTARCCCSWIMIIWINIHFQFALSVPF